MTMQRWRPRGITRRRPLIEEMEDIFEPLFWDLPSVVVWQRRPADGMAWAPSVDIYEKENAFTVKAELPGVSMEGIDISMSGNTLTIKGERKAPENIKEDEYQRCEMCYGKFSRSISFSVPINTEKIDATLENGILEIRLPKAAEEKMGKIPIKAKSQSKSKSQ